MSFNPDEFNDPDIKIVEQRLDIVDLNNAILTAKIDRVKFIVEETFTAVKTNNCTLNIIMWFMIISTISFFIYLFGMIDQQLKQYFNFQY